MRMYSNSPLSLPASPREQVKQLRDVFRQAFDILGGADWLVEFALKNDGNARVFLQTVSKLLPQTVDVALKSTKLDNMTDEDLARLSIAELTKFVIDGDYEIVKEVKN